MDRITKPGLGRQPRPHLRLGSDSELLPRNRKPEKGNQSADTIVNGTPGPRAGEPGPNLTARSPLAGLAGRVDDSSLTPDGYGSAGSGHWHSCVADSGCAATTGQGRAAGTVALKAPRAAQWRAQLHTPSFAVLHRSAQPSLSLTQPHSHTHRKPRARAHTNTQLDDTHNIA